MKKMDIEKKRAKEMRVVEEMIKLYCRGNHGKTLCPSCEELIAYARMRTQRCPFMEKKTFCSNCKVHCYEPNYRKQIQKVMRYSGMRMLFHHPFLVISHMIESIKEKRRLKKETER